VTKHIADDAKNFYLFSPGIANSLIDGHIFLRAVSPTLGVAPLRLSGIARK
jgi:hypothetical protein